MKFVTNSLYTLLAKCTFYQDKIKFLGFVLGLNGLRIDKTKVQTIHNVMRAPNRKKVSPTFEHLIQNLKAYNGVRI